jgi:pSer/pThr/pTyr-binding forkhead associated (FHA) protein
MAKLILSMDGLVLKEIPLAKERTTIGRKPHNDIQIDNLAVSGEHAVIVTILNDSFLEDLGSTNGTVVNGNAIKKHFLQNNDIVELGKYKLKFVGEAVPAAAGAGGGAEKADFEKTMVLRPSQMKAASEQARAMAAAAGGGVAGAQAAAVAQRAAAVQAAGQSATAAGIADKDPKPAPAAAPAAAVPASATATAPARPAQPMGAIQLLSGANAGKELELNKPLTTLGKPGVQVAVLTRRPQGYFITHVEGSSRPAVNGQQIGAAPHALKDHDVIELAGVKMEFFIKA